MDLKSLSPKDAKIVRDNPGATPYELLSLGLSQKAYEKLSSQPATEVKTEDTVPAETPVEKTESLVTADTEVVIPASITPVTEKKKVVHTTPISYNTVQKTASGSVRILNKRTGKVVVMSETAAKRLLKYPNEYAKA